MALSAELEVQMKEGKIIDAPMAVDIIYRGAICMYNTSGYLAPAATGAGVMFAGIALETVDNSGGSAGDLSCKVQTEGVYLLTGSGFAQTDVGEAVYASADDTITQTSTNNPPIGNIVKYVSSTQVWVKLDPAPAVAS